MDRTNERPPSSLPIRDNGPAGINGATPLSDANEVGRYRERPQRSVLDVRHEWRHHVDPDGGVAGDERGDRRASPAEGYVHKVEAECQEGAPSPSGAGAGELVLVRGRRTTGLSRGPPSPSWSRNRASQASRWSTRARSSGSSAQRASRKAAWASRGRSTASSNRARTPNCCRPDGPVSTAGSGPTNPVASWPRDRGSARGRPAATPSG